MNDLRNHLIALERRLLEPEVRASRAELDHLLADDFLEFGASGVRFGKAEALARLPDEQHPEFTNQDFELRQLAPDVALLTYRATLRRPDDPAPRYSLRSSLWKKNGEQWQMVFHQGTPLPSN